MDKQMIKYIGILCGLLLLIVIYFLLTRSSGIKLEYRDIEAKMVSAARSYAKDHPKVLPTSLNSSQTISTKLLTSEGYLNDISSYAKDDVNCNGSIEIFQTIEGVYNYVPSLSCGKYFETQKLSAKIIEDNLGGTIEGPGLYVRYNGQFLTNENDLDRLPADEYVFRGEGIKNYIKVEDSLWRVVAIDQEGNILAILVSGLRKGSTWDNRYNSETSRYEGVNEYTLNGISSRLMQSVDNVFNEKVALEDAPYSSRIKYLVTPMTLCYGKRSPSDSSIDGSSECSDILEDVYMGVLPAYYYMSASLDENCDSTTSKSCGNYNYLASISDSSWWTLTANSKNTNEAYMVNKRVLTSETCSYTNEVKPIILIGKRAAYSKGTGSKDDPYIIRYFPKNS